MNFLSKMIFILKCILILLSTASCSSSSSSSQNNLPLTNSGIISPSHKAVGSSERSTTNNDMTNILEQPLTSSLSIPQNFPSYQDKKTFCLEQASIMVNEDPNIKLFISDFVGINFEIEFIAFLLKLDKKNY